MMSMRKGKTMAFFLKHCFDLMFTAVKTSIQHPNSIWEIVNRCEEIDQLWTTQLESRIYECCAYQDLVEGTAILAGLAQLRSEIGHCDSPTFLSDLSS